MLHALGLLHEHQRPDRDQYINVDMAAVAKTGLLSQFKKAGFLGDQSFTLNTLNVHSGYGRLSCFFPAACFI